MNDSTQEVKVALNEMSAGNKAILQEIKNLWSKKRDCPISPVMLNLFQHPHYI